MLCRAGWMVVVSKHLIVFRSKYAMDGFDCRIVAGKEAIDVVHLHD